MNWSRGKPRYSNTPGGKNYRRKGRVYWQMSDGYKNKNTSNWWWMDTSNRWRMTMCNEWRIAMSNGWRMAMSNEWRTDIKLLSQSCIVITHLLHDIVPVPYHLGQVLQLIQCVCLPHHSSSCRRRFGPVAETHTGCDPWCSGASYCGTSSEPFLYLTVKCRISNQLVVFSHDISQFSSW